MLACNPEPAARPQLVVFIDTDAPLVGQLASSPELSLQAAIDAVRIDVLGSDGAVREIRDIGAADARDWPLSFGIASTAGASRHVLLRIRAFRSARASRGVLDKATTVDPPHRVLIDRLVELEQPESGVVDRTIVLAMACFGSPASFTTPLRTCVDAVRRNVAPDSGEAGRPTGTRAGTAPESREKPCNGEPPAGARCIPGGFTILGDERLATPAYFDPSTPLRAVALSPFFMDETEFTVGRYRALLARGVVKEVPPTPAPSNDSAPFATWRGRTDASNDAFPLNFVPYSLAKSACEAVGGSLPTEARWEHASRGRGRGWAYPWGDDEPICCSAGLERSSGVGAVNPTCGAAGSGVEPAGSHRDRGCDGPSDVSPDGILDLAGSLTEATLDGGLSYAAACWSPLGLPTDPSCLPGETSAFASSRGGSWNGSFYLAQSAVRTRSPMPTATTGFRCVYEDQR